MRHILKYYKNYYILKLYFEELLSKKTKLELFLDTELAIVKAKKTWLANFLTHVLLLAPLRDLEVFFLGTAINL